MGIFRLDKISGSWVDMEANDMEANGTDSKLTSRMTILGTDGELLVTRDWLTGFGFLDASALKQLTELLISINEGQPVVRQAMRPM